MRAGVLRYILEFVETIETQSPSGFISKEEKVIYTARAQKLKQLARYDKDGFTAKEQFDGQILKFRLRVDPRIEKTDLVKFRGVLHRIILRDFNVYDNSVIITIVKKDV